LEIAREINNDLQNINNGQFFDIQADISRNGPPISDFQVSISIKEDNFEKLQTASIAVSKELEKACLRSDRTVYLNAECNKEGETKLIQKVDDGYTGKQERIIEIKLDKQKILENGLILPTPGAPESIFVNSQIAQSFEINRGQSVADLTTKDSEILPIYVTSKTKTPTTIQEIKDFRLFTQTGQTVALSEVAQINETISKQSIDRFGGQVIGLVNGRIVAEYADDQAIVGLITDAVVGYYSADDFAKTKELGLEKESITQFSDGASADTFRSFGELLVALVLAIFVSYAVLALFFGSFTQPLSIIYTIPLTFVGIFPGLAYLGGAQFGFLEIIGLIILVGIVENVAIFLLNTANQKIREDDMNDKDAVALAAGLRLRSVVLTSLTAVASLAPLAIFSIFYRSIAIVIMFGIFTSGVVSLITTPILFIFFRWMSANFYKLSIINRLLTILSPIVGGLLVYISAGNILLSIIGILLLATPIWFAIYFGIKTKPRLK